MSDPQQEQRPQEWFWSGNCLMRNLPDRFASEHLLVLDKRFPNLPESDVKALIAAAPDLLAACEAIVTACDSAPPMQLMQHIAAACKKARTAISKAKGA
jgi:type VI protein secretion system component VasF